MIIPFIRDGEQIQRYWIYPHGDAILYKIKYGYLRGVFRCGRPRSARTFDTEVFQIVVIGRFDCDVLNGVIDLQSQIMFEIMNKN
jgi:hypothetical protein